MQFTGYAFLTLNRNQLALVQPSQVGSACDRRRARTLGVREYSQVSIPQVGSACDRPPCGWLTAALLEFQSLKWVQPAIDTSRGVIAAGLRPCFNPSSGFSLRSTLSGPGHHAHAARVSIPQVGSACDRPARYGRQVPSPDRVSIPQVGSACDRLQPALRR